jgi:carbon-monoxide dehydrogenase large subunit
MAEAAFVRSSEAHARIKSIDATAALALPGVIAIFTMADFGAYAEKRTPQPLPHPMIKQSPTPYPLANGEVCYVGESVAMLIAENRYIAEDAANLVQIEYETLPTLVDVRAASRGDAPRVNHQTESNVVASVAARFGDSAAALRQLLMSSESLMCSTAAEVIRWNAAVSSPAMSPRPTFLRCGRRVRRRTWCDAS